MHLVAAFYATGDTRTPVAVAAVDFCVFFALAVTLMRPFGHVGIGLAVPGSSLVQLLLLALPSSLGASMDSNKPKAPRIVDARFVAGATAPNQLPPSQQVEVAFAGRSNVGKSSLMNALLERKKLVRTSSTPGCTRQISVFEITTRNAEQLSFVDLPGYGYAKRSRVERRQWGDLIEHYLATRASLAAVVSLVDIRRGVQEDDEQLAQLVALKPGVTRAPLRLIRVATKLDKLPAAKRKPALAELNRQSGHSWLGFSTELPETHEQLWKALLRAMDLTPAPPGANQ